MKAFNMRDALYLAGLVLTLGVSVGAGKVELREVRADVDSLEAIVAVQARQTATLEQIEKRLERIEGILDKGRGGP